MKRFLYIFIFACLVAERDGFFERKYETPLRWLGVLLFETKFLVMPVVDACILLLLFGSTPAWRRTDPMHKALWVSVGAVALATGWGVLNGGSAYQAQFQVHAMVVSALLALAIRKILQTPEEYVTLGKIIVGAAVYRALSIIAYYIFCMAGTGWTELPHVITSHDDSVTFAAAFAFLVLYAAMRPSARAVRNAVLICALIVIAIYFNNRRIVYVSLGGGLLACYSALPTSPLKRRINRKLLPILPLVLLYVIVGWGRTEKIFKPIASISSMTSEETDSSAKSRQNENMGLVVTFGQNRFLGTGFGHEFIEVDDSLAPKHFSQYKYMPHNSVLGLLAFGGIAFFTGMWMVFPVCAFFAARGIRQTRSPTVRLLGMGTLTLVVVCTLQAWGDMGLICYSPTFIMACGFACASHLPYFEMMATPAQTFAAPAPPRLPKRPPIRAVGRTSPSA